MHQLIQLSIFITLAFLCCRLTELQGDLIAGFTIGLTVLPQSIAYAAIAGIPAQVKIMILLSLALLSPLVLSK